MGVLLIRKGLQSVKVRDRTVYNGGLRKGYEVERESGRQKLRIEITLISVKIIVVGETGKRKAVQLPKSVREEADREEEAIKVNRFNVV